MKKTMNEVVFPATFPVTAHTDFIRENSIFVAIKGTKEDGVNYIPLALARGAKIIVVNKDVILSPELIYLIQDAEAELYYVDNARRALAELSAHAHNFPAQKLRIIAITGTKGKTTSSFLLEHLLKTAGYKTALLSSVYNKILDQQFSTHLTTQHPDYLHAFFDLCVQYQIDFVVMEVAAQAISLDRVYGIEFDAILFTNFGHEHGEFYAHLSDYFAAKCQLIKQAKEDAPILVNADDNWCNKLIDQKNIVGFSINNPATYQAIIINNNLHNNLLDINKDDKKLISCSTNLGGLFNSYNITGTVAIANSLGISSQIINSALASFNRVPGRLERYALPNGAQCIIDYASNPLSFQSILSLLRSYTQHLIVVFGAGGDRDSAKRPLMGELAAQYADNIIITTDNPRSENSADIAQQVIAGIESSHHHKIIIELDRQQAIQQAYEISKKDSIIALLGKGADEYQLVQNEKIPFSERKIVESLC